MDARIARLAQRLQVAFVDPAIPADERAIQIASEDFPMGVHTASVIELAAKIRDLLNLLACSVP